MKSIRGLTLLETVVVLSLMLGLMGLVTMFFIRGQRYAIATETYADVQRSATLLLGRLSDELYRSTRHHLLIGEDNSAVAALSFSPVEPSEPDEPAVEFDETNGSLVWKMWVCFYYEASTKRLLRVEMPLAHTMVDLTQAPVPASDFVSFKELEKRRPIGRNIKSFQVFSSPGGVSVTVTAAREVPLPTLTESQKNVSVSVRMEVNVLN